MSHIKLHFIYSVLVISRPPSTTVPRRPGERDSSQYRKLRLYGRGYEMGWLRFVTVSNYQPISSGPLSTCNHNHPGQSSTATPFSRCHCTGVVFPLFYTCLYEIPHPTSTVLCAISPALHLSPPILSPILIHGQTLRSQHVHAQHNNDPSRPTARQAHITRVFHLSRRPMVARRANINTIRHNTQRHSPFLPLPPVSLIMEHRLHAQRGRRADECGIGLP